MEPAMYLEALLQVVGFATNCQLAVARMDFRSEATCWPNVLAVAKDDGVAERAGVVKW